MTDQSEPADIGSWEPVRDRFQHLPVHMALLHTGKVLAFGGSGNDETQLDTPHPSELWDPDTGETKTIDQELAGDLFCVGHSFLPDGRLLAAGGTHKYSGDFFGLPLAPFAGLEQAYIFDPDLETWTRVDNMGYGRWYPTLVTLGDGRIIAMAGLTKGFPWAFLRTLELYSPGQGWSKLKGAERWLPLYPRLHLLPNGEIFYAGSFNTHYTFPFSLKGFPTAILNVRNRAWRTIGPPNTSQREEGGSILLPLTPPDYEARVLLVGGGSPFGKMAAPDAEIINLSEDAPSWELIQPMEHARYYVYPVLLPDGNVLVVGGRSGTKGHSAPATQDGQGHSNGDHEGAEIPHDPQAVLEAELFNPSTKERTKQWTTMAPMAVDRLYHSNALLLPDGRVMVAGSNPHRRVNELRIEIYRPPYLYRGERPSIEQAPASIGYGESFEIRSLEAASIDKIALIRQSATTHCLNTDQRYVGLEILNRQSQTIGTRITENKNLAPPGHYMLFILREGVPSVGRFVSVS